MTTYLVLNLILFVSIFLFLPKQWKVPPQSFWITLAGLVVLTAIFDPIIIALDIVAYDDAKLLGIYWFGAPVEDFFYAVYAAIIVPLVWIKLGERHNVSKS